MSHPLPGCPTAFSRTMRCLLLGQCKWTSDSTVSLLNVGLSISSSAGSTPGCWWEEHLQCSQPLMQCCHKGIPFSSIYRHPGKFCSPREPQDMVSEKVWSCEPHHAPRQVTHQDIQPKSKHRQLLVVAWQSEHCSSSISEDKNQMTLLNKVAMLQCPLLQHPHLLNCQ